MRNIIKKTMLVMLTTSIFLSFFSVSGNSILCQPAYAAGERKGLDPGMTKRVQDDGMESQLPFQEWWTVDLKRVEDGKVVSNGKVYSQPIIVEDQNAIYVQAGRDLIKLEGYQQATKDSPPQITARFKNINKNEWPSASTPTYARTQYGPRIYQATRDHRLYALDPETLRPLWDKPIILSAGNRPEYRYRVTTSPMVQELDGKTLISVGTAHGDLTGLEPERQYADNGFFVIQDKGTTYTEWKSRFTGEITASPIFVEAGIKKIVGMENTLESSNKIINIEFNEDLSDATINRTVLVRYGVASSPSYRYEDGKHYVYFIDREGVLYKVDIESNERVWQKEYATGNTRALEGFTIGDKYVFAAIRHFHTRSTGGNGAVLAIDKKTGILVKTINLSDSIRNDVLYWRPDPNEPGYIIIQTADGSIQFVQEDTWERIKWFQDKKGNLLDTAKLPGTMDQHNSPELVFADNLLLTIDGDGIMHAYKSVRPNNLAVTEFKVAGSKKLEDYKVGETIPLDATFANTSEKAFKSVEITLKGPDGQVLKTITKDMDARSEFSHRFEVVNDTGLPWFEVLINEKRNNPPDEVTWDDNKKSIMLPVDIRVDDFKLNKQTVSAEENDVTATVKVFLKPLFETNQKFSLKTKVRLMIGSYPLTREITLASNEQMTLNIPFTVKEEQLKLGAIPVTAQVNGDFAIYEPTSPASIRENNFAGPLVLISQADADLIAVSINAPNSTTYGSKVKVAATVKNAYNKPQKDVLIRFYADNTKIYEVKTNFLANQTKEVGGFVWTANQVGNVNLSVHVDPLKTAMDGFRSNNVKTRTIDVKPHQSDVSSCSATKPNGSWDVTYWIITGYETRTGIYTWTDEEGNLHTETYTYTDYSSPIWEPRTVRYNESLTATVTVNTKQGIPTDPKHPKESDRESRGSWAIIPWAAKNGLDPNEVTRAGYGFELQVVTQYTTDYETKVPKGLEGTAQPLGGSPSGPTEVVAKIYDTRGKYVAQIQLEKTGGDNRTATWELPEEIFRASTGEVFRERKFYTDVNAPDGEYIVQVFAKNAGQTGLSYCGTKKVIIYGSMYDDSQSVRDTSGQ